ncbi:MAG: enoyl-CoA hydratase/isomerase family protein [Kangiellaceae bacterium]|nr:enoyl-CoA hydratase/isomerase family protein [Kangiellaceae bacterium]
MSTEKKAASITVKMSSNGVARVTLNRPDIHNAFDDQFIKELTRAIEKIERNNEIRILVLDAAGKSFSAGADLNWMKRMATYSWEENYQDSLKLAGLMQALYESSKTTVAVVQGAAFGGGVGLVACCDIVLASNKALFCLSEVKLGLIPSVISPYVVKAIGERNCKRYFATAERFNVSEAQQMQLVHKIIPHEELTDFRKDFVNKLLANGPIAMYQSKQLIDHVVNKPINEALVLETAHRIADIRASNEGREGVSAFLDKRPANWKATIETEF